MKIRLIELYHLSVPLREMFWSTWIPKFREKGFKAALNIKNARMLIECLMSRFRVQASCPIQPHL